MELVITNEVLNYIVASLMAALSINSWFMNQKVQYITLQLELIKQNVTDNKVSIKAQAIISQQVAIASNHSPQSVQRFNVTQKIAVAIQSSFNIEDLKTLAFDLDIDHVVEWSTLESASRTIIEHMYLGDRLLELTKYMVAKRPKIEF